MGGTEPVLDGKQTAAQPGAPDQAQGRRRGAPGAARTAAFMPASIQSGRWVPHRG